MEEEPLLTIIEIEQRIKRILISELEVNPEILATISSSTPLLGRGIGLDSIETLALVAGIEEEFNILVDDEDLTVALFSKIGNLAEYVLHKITEQRD
jgi:acyl carrier protein